MSSQSYFYDCNMRPKMLTAYTTKNYGRRFLKCPNGRCKYFHWYDSPLDNNTIKRIEKLEEKNKHLEANINVKDKQLTLMWCLVFVLISEMLFSKWFK